jgi:hypothetical protein
MATGILVAVTLALSSCNDYLDVVPDNTITLEDFFSRKEQAWNALAKIYSFLPNDPFIHDTWWMLGDEWIGHHSLDNDGSFLANRIMRGLQRSNDPFLGIWSGNVVARPLYKAIRSTNIFIMNINNVEDMSEKEKADWKAQAQFLKAYYHFLLLRQYGPIVIADKIIEPDASLDQLWPRRSKVDDCFDYIIRLMDEAIPNLNESAIGDELGQVDRTVAVAIKARVLLFRASPFFNGNSEFYANFLDYDGKPFFSLEERSEKWQDALEGVNEAIELCESNGKGLYTYDKAPYVYDREDFNANKNMQTLYDLRMVIVDPWNKELIWGQTYDRTANATLANCSNIVLPKGYNGLSNELSFSYQLIASSYRMLERYYTNNGLPPEVDLTFDQNKKYEVVATPGVTDLEYEQTRGFLQPGAQTIRLYMNREPRFYANLGITGGYWRAHAERIPTMMFAGTAGGRSSLAYYLYTGIGVQKLVHPESKSGAWTRVVTYPLPIIRMADLYLMKAEILNEIGGPSPLVYESINKVRRRAGIPNVETVWSDPSLVRSESLNKHQTKEGMREIILRERSIEFAFEGASRYWDAVRYKKAVDEFNFPIRGWKVSQDNADGFFQLETKESRRFIQRDYLWPIDLNEINTNKNIVQNPGWE